ncbi:D-alanyl-D-alanine carboxypeptidase [Streptomyces lancefieldiae]|uniref:serine-type D-Ala-D-Ala carboxypeptidase n=1 Tax=Streptomyces lancefieldiae TaxID=3075520 RepID=A0ABU3AXJ1_9ACTN|nr:D-alanyl-D-alanine carboxypeptidase [Streptomyces sp. DSM 40712]MDT0614297.1 D-alanyl-D-alanine carboxypeptidase [Streptomyces sp. DSM 40712]
MEEASVAGESPDRSKQRESSEEPTSGSAGPVPEARTGASEAGDPRAAVTHEGTKPSASAASRGGVDTATRVLSRRGTEAETETETETEDADRAEDSGSSEGDRAEPVDTTEVRLRDAVATWVATADERAAANAGGEDASAEDSEDTEDTEDAAEEDAEGAGASEGPQEHADGPEKADDGPDADTDAEDAAEDAEDAEGAEGAGASEDPQEHADGPEKADDKSDDGPDDAAVADEEGATPVDQPTAVFKAPRPSAPAVDQPTTMLKLGDAAAALKKADEAGKARKADADAERTSKFVALRNPDDPATRKPPSSPQSPSAPSKAAPKAPQTPRTAAAPSLPYVGPEHTTQQPLPPKPPLDLLAELTNTPPPPETPLRTTVRRIKIWTPLVILLVIVFGVVQAMRPLPEPTLVLTAQESFTFEGGKPEIPWPSSGQAALDVQGIGSFGSAGEQKPVPIASVAKVMTVYLVLRDHPLKPGAKGPNIEVDAAAQKHYETGKPENESVVKVTEGQQITEYEALQAVMLPSANNVAKLLARWDSGSSSEDEFVAKMNKTAKELGMKNTTYTDPSGLDKTTVSTAEDLVKLGRAAMADPVFREISKQPSYVDLNGEQQNNYFGLVPTVAIGIKTGTTTAAGGNILFAAEKNVGGKTHTIIGAALGQYGQNGVANIDKVTAVVRELIESGQDALTAKTIVKKGDVVGQVDDGMGGTTPVVATKDVSAVGWSGLTVKLKLDESSGGTVPHTAKAGTKVGTLTVGDGSSAETVDVPVALRDDLAEPPLTAKLTRTG